MFLIYTAKLTTEEQNVTISATADHTNFTCEMSDYILPDENMKWIGNDGAVLERSDKYTISFENGNQFMAQNGGSTRLPSRVSILTIHNPTICDAGNYFCTLDGTRQIITMTLEVKPTDDGTYNLHFISEEQAFTSRYHRKTISNIL